MGILEMKEGWRPAGPDLVLDRAVIEAMLRPAVPGARVRAARRIQGGLANLNYRVDLEGRTEPLLLRVYLRDPQAAPLEAALSWRLHGLVPVPAFLAVEPSNPATGHAYAITSWLEGERLGSALGPAETCAPLGRAVGAALAALGRVLFPEPGMLDAALHVACPMAGGRAGFLEILHMVESDLVFERLGSTLAAAYRSLVERESHLLEALQNEAPCLVHSDFDPSNILVLRTGSGWQVSGVLDWEYAHSGSPLVDLGHILRPPAVGLPGFQQGLVEGYAGGGGKLPPHWRAISRLMDLTAFVEFLSRPDAGAEVIHSARLAIQDTIRTWER
jgi:aminoglycoside phosphotransferase (APT) family kinase protein